MTQQFTIQSESLRDKLNSLLPSQNLGSIGVELTGKSHWFYDWSHGTNCYFTKLEEQDTGLVNRGC